MAAKSELSGQFVESSDFKRQIGLTRRGAFYYTNEVQSKCVKEGKTEMRKRQ